MWEFIRQHWGDIASVGGLIAAIIAARQASNAKKAVAELRAVLLRMDTVTELTAAISMMEEIKRLHRINATNAWLILPERYAVVREKLVFIRSANPGLLPEQQAKLDGIIVDLRVMENRAEKLSISRNPASDSIITKANENFSNHVDTLNGLLTDVKKDIGV